MSRLISMALTEASIVNRSKTVTRRRSWWWVEPGEQLIACRKVMGVDGTVEPLVRLAVLVVVSAWTELLREMSDDDVAREAVPGLEHVTAAEWVAWFARTMRCSINDPVRRIEFRYADMQVAEAV